MKTKKLTGLYSDMGKKRSKGDKNTPKPKDDSDSEDNTQGAGGCRG